MNTCVGKSKVLNTTPVAYLVCNGSTAARQQIFHICIDDILISSSAVLQSQSPITAQGFIQLDDLIIIHADFLYLQQMDV
jgi:hypothetical protein